MDTVENQIRAEAAQMIRENVAEAKVNLFQQWRMGRMTECAKELQQFVDDLGWETVQNILDDTTESAE